jgi:hypothetical protein
MAGLSLLLESCKENDNQTKRAKQSADYHHCRCTGSVGSRGFGAVRGFTRHHCVRTVAATR